MDFPFPLTFINKNIQFGNLNKDKTKEIHGSKTTKFHFVTVIFYLKDIEWSKITLNFAFK